MAAPAIKWFAVNAAGECQPDGGTLRRLEAVGGAPLSVVSVIGAAK
jgi:hypothetical protein